MPIERMHAGRFLRVAAKSVFALIDPLFDRFPGPRILIYHQVGVDLGREMEVPTETFRRQLDWMQSHGEIVELETAIERRGEADADRLFVLTFDDGFEDVHHNAFPILKERGTPFTLYLTTNPIETGEPLDPRYPAARPLTWDQVNEMIGTGLVTVGAHTHTHPDLRKLDSEAIADELDTSNSLIEEHTGVSPRHFTYPWGRWSDAAAPFVAERYETATVGSASLRQRSSADLHHVHRLPVQRSDIGPLFARKVVTAAPTEARLRANLQRSNELVGLPRVAFVSVTHGLGGPTRSLVTLLESLDGMVDRTLVAPSGPFVKMVLERGAAEGSHLMPKWRSLRWRWLSRTSRLVAAVDFFVWALRHRRSIDCLHANGQAELNIVAPTASLLRIPLVMWAHASLPSPSARLLGPVWRGLLKDTSWVAVSEEAKRALEDSRLLRPNAAVQIIPNPISASDVVEGTQVRRNGSSVVTVGYFGGKAESAGFHLLPDVVEAVDGVPLRWLLFTAPPGPAATRLQIRTWSRLEPLVGDVIEVRGKVPDVRSGYAECDIVFCPSNRESFGRVAAEAMLNGLPVVGSDILPFDRLIGDRRAGLLFPVGDARAAAARLVQLASDPELRNRLGREGKVRAQAFDPQLVGARFTDVYSSASR